MTSYDSDYSINKIGIGLECVDVVFSGKMTYLIEYDKIIDGKVAEWLKALVLKTRDGNIRRFESCPFRQNMNRPRGSYFVSFSPFFVWFSRLIVRLSSQGFGF